MEIFSKLIIIASFVCGTMFSSCAQEKVIFQEDFNGDSLDMSVWNYEEGDGCPNLCGWGNNEEQIYDRRYVEVKDGNMVITALKEADQYYSGKINSKENVEFTYGVIEMRVKLATTKGLWPAIWMLGSDIDEVSWPASGEIDLMEYIGRKPNIIYSTLHTPANHGDNGNSKQTEIEGIEEGYHIFKTIWTKDYIEYFVDGKQVYRFKPKKYDAENYPFRKDFYFLVNMAIGGNLGGAEIHDSELPAKFYVDYIKVTELPKDLK
ncbi:glycoside hydrolase family 16 protein [Christiangramia forsetii]|uniref:Glycosyl hydrolase, family 16 n=2 Tax=Christiangramia forsetii TaxID=411153 RepID=A0M712_CHRFK|nr:glycoside hydrolase family 16 protein [Christiangramia forsetii]GGG28999.1 hypothetical protein GCM10011532_10570 [Christiangramia forsetii]CAL68407.1 glycosyl hydrolase, family 16 [Christiangramia forsetii KT0803]